MKRGLLFLCLFGMADPAWATTDRVHLLPSAEFLEPGHGVVSGGSQIAIKSRDDGTDRPPGVRWAATHGIWGEEDFRIQSGLSWDEYLLSDTRILHAHLKTGIKERESIPGLELGIFDFSFRSGLNDPNFIFVFLTKEISKIGQLSLGWYWGNGVDLRDEQGLPANRGLLASLRRPLSEWTSDLEILGEFISGTNRYSSGSAGLAWSWNPKSQLKSFYVWPLNRKLVGEYMSMAISVEY